MLRHNLLLIYRNFKRFKSTFFINLIGLSTGLACLVLIYLWVNDELHFDKFHQKDSRLFQVMEHLPHADGIVTSAETPELLAETLAEEMSEIEYAAVSTPPAWFPQIMLSVEGKGNTTRNIKAAGNFVGKDYFNVFSYHLTQGDAKQVLKDKNAIVISEQVALRLFNTTENIIGKSVVWKFDNLTRTALISGVFKGTPANSSVQFGFLLSFDMFKEIMDMGKDLTTNGPFLTYLTVKEGTNLGHLNRKIIRLFQSRFKGAPRQLFLKPYSENYLYGTYENGVQSGGRIEYVKLFSLIALFILMIACINFMNLSTAKASRRIKEVGIKKAVGASRRNLIIQYLGESMLMTFLSLVTALLLVAFLLPQFNQITGKHLTLHLEANLIFSLLGIILVTGFIAGSYPALYLSGFNPVMVLKGGGGKFNSSVGELWARKGLVVFQFTLSVIFIVSVLVVYQQLAYVQSKNLGYDKDHVIYFESEGKVPTSMTTFLAEIKNLPGILQASSMVGNLHLGSTRGIPWNGNTPNDIIQFRTIQANYGLIETLGIEMKAGRAFSRDFGADSAKIIFNEAAITAMGIKDPIGKVINFNGGEREILGVVKNFHHQSLYEKVKPLFFILEKQTGTIMVKMKAGAERETIERLQQYYKAYNPGFSFDYKFLDEDYQAQYAAEKRVSVLARYFAGLAILISCLGLFGLAAFTAERRRKEIGIRKVFGASEASIVYLLSGGFTKLVFASIVMALPISYFIAKHWLDNFAYRIELEVWYFMGAGFMALFVAWLTVGMQAIKASRINPAICLRDE
jgi:putative ABC transport system permease protein